MIEITWSMFGAEDPFAPIAEKNVTLLRDWAACRENAESAARDIAADYFIDEELWDEEWGLDCTSAEVLLEIFSPLEIAGTYNIELQRVVKARASEVADPRPQRV